MTYVTTILLCGDRFLDSIHHLDNNIKIFKIVTILKSLRFGSFLCFRLQVNGGEEEKNTYSDGPLRQT
jgi:hypothetical protein